MERPGRRAGRAARRAARGGRGLVGRDLGGLLAPEEPRLAQALGAGGGRPPSPPQSRVGSCTKKSCSTSCCAVGKPSASCCARARERETTGGGAERHPRESETRPAAAAAYVNVGVSVKDRVLEVLGGREPLLVLLARDGRHRRGDRVGRDAEGQLERRRVGREEVVVRAARLAEALAPRADGRLVVALGVGRVDHASRAHVLVLDRDAHRTRGRGCAAAAAAAAATAAAAAAAAAAATAASAASAAAAAATAGRGGHARIVAREEYLADRLRRASAAAAAAPSPALVRRAAAAAGRPRARGRRSGLRGGALRRRRLPGRPVRGLRLRGGGVAALLRRPLGLELRPARGGEGLSPRDRA